MNLAQLFNHWDGCLVIGTAFYCFWYYVGMIRTTGQTIIFAVLYNFGGLIQYWGK